MSPPSTDLVTLLEHIWNSFTAREQFIVQRRFVDSSKCTLQELGEHLELTRERVRQLEAKIVERCERAIGIQLEKLRKHLVDKYGAMIPKDAFTGTIDRKLTGVSSRNKALFTKIFLRYLKYHFKNDFYLSPAGDIVISNYLHYINTNNLLLVDEMTLARINLEFWYKYRDEIKQCLGLVRLRYGSFARKDSVSTRVLDTLKHLGIPATKEQIAEYSGIPEEKLTNRLRLIRGVVKVSNNMWGLGSSKSTQYVGVVDEMLTVIEQHGGQVSVQTLKSEIKRRCNVKDSTITAYLYTTQFVIENKMIRLSTENDVRLRPLAQTIDGRTGNGAPYWIIKVKARHLKGHSVVGLPPELAYYLKCEPNTRSRIPIHYPLECRDMSITWRLASTTGLQIGYLADVMKKLRVQEGDQVRLIVQDGARVGFERHSPIKCQ
ncbi:MAG: hypothetical protein OXH31_07845 [Gammaproteobacteria bacterium]|nr:hypothetical protein [Gammaproteobacteria bacterium]